MSKNVFEVKARTMPKTMTVQAFMYVDDAADSVSWLIRRESRGPRDLENAMRRLEARYGIPYAVLWSLRYRKPKDILVSVYARIKDAHEAEINRQRSLLEHEQSITKAKTKIGAFLNRAANSLASEKDGDLE